MKKHSHTDIQYGYDINHTNDDSLHDDISEVRNLWPDESRDDSNRSTSDTHVKSSYDLSKYHTRGSSFFKIFIVSCALCRWFFIGTETRIANDDITEYKTLIESSGSFTPHFQTTNNDMHRPHFIVLVTMSEGFESMWYNWLSHFKALEIPNLPVHVFAEDDNSYIKCIKQQQEQHDVVDLVCLSPETVFGIVQEEDQIHNSHNPKDYYSKEYKRMMSRRPQIIQYELENNRNTHIIFSDLDAVWKKNPIPYFDEISSGSVDILASVDGGITTMRTKDKVLPALCPGFMILRSCPATLEVVTKWRSNIEGKLRRNQPAFNSVLSQYGWTFDRTTHSMMQHPLVKKKKEHESVYELVVQSLHPKLFAGGDYYFHNMTKNEREEAVVVHFNGIGPDRKSGTSGYEKKLNKMKEYNLWM